jgi:hypothetical protein
MLRHVTPIVFSAFCVVGNKRQTTSGLSTDIYQKMYQSLFKISKCLLSFAAEHFVFQFVARKFKGFVIQKYSFAC